MINIHLGMPRVGFRSLDFCARSFRSSSESYTYFLPKEYYRENIRSTINAPRILGSQAEVARIQDLFQEHFSYFDVISMSQPALLGDPVQLIVSARARKKAANRVKMLTEIFCDGPIRFHVMVTEPIEYLFRVFGNEAEDFVNNFGGFSWAGLIDEIGLTKQDNSVVVWDCTGGSEILCQFLGDFFDQPKEVANALYGASLGYRFPDPSAIKLKFSDQIKRRLPESLGNYRRELAEVRNTQL
jgi:hypothetical protein